MSDCKACILLAGESTKVGPHEGLSGGSTFTRSDGHVEAYKCRDCGARWQRFVTNATFGGAPQYWKRL